MYKICKTFVEWVWFSWNHQEKVCLCGNFRLEKFERILDKLWSWKRSAIENRVNGECWFTVVTLPVV